MGTGISKKLKTRVWKRDNGFCHYCGRFVSRIDPDRTLDHVIPKSKGGPARMWNLVLSCKRCNRDKANTDPNEKQLALAFKRRDLTDLMISIGKLIERKKLTGQKSAATNLIDLQSVIQEVLFGSCEEAKIKITLDTIENLVHKHQ